ncbi:PTS lactose/cellobiose transporter subunit IIA [Anaerobranca gottschalkii]|uniref:PTS system, cellobiose-specific IIA component n=1 Tax=Anaerobranca gottschalkii DSM 13577 TaxID=1120990 RepID=A0A1I0AMM7_9FIRM|nr:PTS lactose/cellobiose transporter subunit IIA [Anaerobranca gottschalkii]SES95642.1 PTS system, cellobiose-specific IIA component [Anaerobranca gottschalkii DSM 13577]
MEEKVIFEIILHAGNARAEAYEALKWAEQGEFDKSKEHMRKSDVEIGIAHKAQTDMIQKEVAGEKIDISLLFVHAQDHLMTAIAEKTLIENLVKMHEKFKKLEERLGGNDE